MSFRSVRFEATPGEADAFRDGAHRMRLVAAAALNEAGLHAAAVRILALPLPDPRPEPTGLEYRGG
jgi:hypothetical protein